MMLAESQRITTVKRIVREAGDITLRHFGHVTVYQKDDQSPVTKADIEAGEYISHHLKINFPSYGIINEESRYCHEDILDRYEYIWVVDPIDGTASFSRRLPIWGVAVGLMKKGKPCMGVVYLPILREIYYTDENLPSYFESPQWGRQKICAADNVPFNENSLLLTVSYFHRKLNIGFSGKIRSMGSTAAHICFVARGDADIAIVKGAIWDIVSGWAILENARGKGVYIDGSIPNFEDMIDGKSCKDFIIMGSVNNVDNIQGKINNKAI